MKNNLPARQEKIVPIAFCTDNNYFPYVATAIKSITENCNSIDQFKIYIFCKDISSQYKTLLQEQINPYNNFTVSYEDVSEYLIGYSFPNMQYSAVAYFRLLIPYILTIYPKVLYLDCDIICLSDISEIFEESGGNYLLDCIRDNGIISNEAAYARSLGLKNHLDYFNSGVLIFNTALFRKHIPLEDLLKLAVSRNWKYADQCLLNVVCKEKVHFIAPRWNVMSDSNLKNVPGSLKREQVKAYKNPGILHYVWDKPWKQFFITERTRNFWFFAKQTPFDNIIFSKLKDIEAVITEVPHYAIYDTILHNRNYGLRFIMKCLLLWMKRQIR